MSKTSVKAPAIADSVERLTEYLNEDSNVLFAVLFGSGAAGRMKKTSDLDVGVYFNRPPEGLKLLDFVSSACDAAGREVDVAVLNNASAFLRHQVMKQRLVLTIKDEAAYRRFREKTMSDYEEYKYISGMDVYDR